MKRVTRRNCLQFYYLFVVDSPKFNTRIRSSVALICYDNKERTQFYAYFF